MSWANIGQSTKGLVTGLMLTLASTSNVFATPELADNKPNVIALAPHIIENLFAVGAGEQVIGTTEHSDYPEAAKTVPRIGNYAVLQIEKILQLKPDYIVAWASGNPPEDLVRIEKLGIPIIYSKPSSLVGVAQELLKFGDLTKNKLKARQVADDYLHKLQVVKQQNLGKKPIKVFYQLWSAPLTTIANHAWPQKILEVCNAQNPFVDLVGDYPHVSVENVLVANPDVIVIPTSSTEPNGQIDYWQKFTSISAVKNNQIYLVNSDKLHRMTPRVVEEMKVLCDKIDLARQFYANQPE
ncbi:periplasmic binding protein [Catenovulum agarivorans DS-2]|uniref:Periplasmic binding protein n=1 Tax=Catenovulum agarivorans DS-2 TaxID=1328313 RepID=W7QQR0_9ALTE|nr:cobalamin-binding protein [Catenovulum agarivorans]EWH11332.1 periplasmic binding protein [Catenovulum agarivorans DS-2]